MKQLRLLTILAVLILFSAGCALLNETPTPSAPLEAVPVQLETAVPEAAVTEPAEAESPADAAGLRVYQIVPSESEVRFELDEDLFGQRKTIVGTTGQVSGEIAVDLSDLSTARVGVIQINARTLATDSSRRDRAINNSILDTAAHEFITFSPTAVSDLPSGAEIGQEIGFTVAGDLTIRDITRPVTFDVTATAVSGARLVGVAQTIIAREAFDLSIPRVPNVANVEEEVELVINFVADAVQ